MGYTALLVVAVMPRVLTPREIARYRFVSARSWGLLGVRQGTSAAVASR
ncbi:hypothetical protein [Synechococcus sp. C9]|nr:hypothetical protein [Synechococcus sp. C9]